MYLCHCNLFLCTVFNTFSPVNTKLFIFVCERFVNLKVNNFPVDVKIFSLCHKETLFQADF